MHARWKSGVIAVAFMQRAAFVGDSTGGRGNKSDLIGILTLSPMIKAAWCREPEVRITIAASLVANFGFKAALES